MEALFLQLLNMSIAAGYLILAVLLLRLILRRAPKAVRLLLWGLVAFRLACPFSLESVLSLIPSGETVTVFGQYRGWYVVLYDDILGYVSAPYVQI